MTGSVAYAACTPSSMAAAKRTGDPLVSINYTLSNACEGRFSLYRYVGVIMNRFRVRHPCGRQSCLLAATTTFFLVFVWFVTGVSLTCELNVEFIAVFITRYSTDTSITGRRRAKAIGRRHKAVEGLFAIN